MKRSIPCALVATFVLGLANCTTVEKKEEIPAAPAVSAPSSEKIEKLPEKKKEKEKPEPAIEKVPQKKENIPAKLDTHRERVIKPTTPSPAPPSKSSLPPLLEEVEAAYKKNETLTADFVQISESGALKTKKQTAGKIYLKRPDKVRWETEEPEKSLLVSDGKEFWFYTPPFDEEENGQVIIRKPSQVQSRLASSLLQGSFSLAKDMRFDQAADNEFVLTPKNPNGVGGVERAKITINPKEKLIESVVLENRGGNRSEINLKNIRLGSEIDPKEFVFEVPAKTDVRRE